MPLKFRPRICLKTLRFIYPALRVIPVLALVLALNLGPCRAAGGTIGFSGHVPQREQGSLATLPGQIVVFGPHAAVQVRLDNRHAEPSEIRLGVHSLDGLAVASNADARTFHLAGQSSGQVLLRFEVATPPIQRFVICVSRVNGGGLKGASQCQRLAVKRID